MAKLEFRVLGPVEIRTSGGDVVPLPSRRGAVLLAALVLRVNRTVPVDELVDLLWDEDELPGNPARRTAGVCLPLAHRPRRHRPVHASHRRRRVLAPR
ncbi:MAG TPA: hypothetical protein VIQ79_26175 [Kribbella sp.]